MYSLQEQVGLAKIILTINKGQGGIDAPIDNFKWRQFENLGGQPPADALKDRGSMLLSVVRLGAILSLQDIPILP